MTEVSGSWSKLTFYPHLHYNSNPHQYVKQCKGSEAFSYSLIYDAKMKKRKRWKFLAFSLKIIDATDSNME